MISQQSSSTATSSATSTSTASAAAWLAQPPAWSELLPWLTKIGWVMEKIEDNLIESTLPSPSGSQSAPRPLSSHGWWLWHWDFTVSQPEQHLQEPAECSLYYREGYLWSTSCEATIRCPEAPPPPRSRSHDDDGPVSYFDNITIRYHKGQINAHVLGCPGCLARLLTTYSQQILASHGQPIGQPGVLPPLPPPPSFSKSLYCNRRWTWKPQPPIPSRHSRRQQDGPVRDRQTTQTEQIGQIERSEQLKLVYSAPSQWDEALKLRSYLETLLVGPWIRAMLLILIWHAIHRLDETFRQFRALFPQSSQSPRPPQPPQPTQPVPPVPPAFPSSFSEYQRAIDLELLAIMLGGSSRT
jgi:hypothetical protein